MEHFWGAGIRRLVKCRGMIKNAYTDNIGLISLGQFCKLFASNFIYIYIYIYILLFIKQIFAYVSGTNMYFSGCKRTDMVAPMFVPRRMVGTETERV